MTDAVAPSTITSNRQRPLLARGLGFAGLLPQVAVVLVLGSGSTWWHFAALSLGYAYAALILSFLGGLWWGVASGQSDRAPAWVWFAAVVPSLIAFATAVPWAVGALWPGPSLAVLGVALLTSLFVDRQLVALRLAPSWWMALRTPLSVGLGVLTLATAILGMQ